MLNERLGHGPEEKLVIIHADDIGMCHSANRASLAALQKGLVTCGAVMFPCPWVLEFAKMFKEIPDVPIGVHLTVTCEWEFYRWGPVAPRGQVAGLIDAQGYLPHRGPEVAARVTALEFEREVRAQIERAFELGFHPTHIDHHMIVPPQRKDLFEIYVRLGKEYGIPPQIFRFHENDYAGLREQGVDASYFDRLEAEGFPIIDGRLRARAGGKTLDELRAAYHESFRRAKPGVNMIKLHLGMYDDELIGVMGEERAAARFNDFQVFTSEMTRQAAQEAGVKIISWKPIKEAFDKAMK